MRIVCGLAGLRDDDPSMLDRRRDADVLGELLEREQAGDRGRRGSEQHDDHRREGKAPQRAPTRLRNQRQARPPSIARKPEVS